MIKMGRSTFEAKATAGLRNDDSFPDGLEQLLAPQPDNSRLVHLTGDVSEHNIAAVVAQMLHLGSVSRKPIHLVISTYGGSIDEMFSLYDTIKFLPCPVHTVALGKVMSAGVLLLASGVKGKRLMGASGRIMIHPVSGGSSGNVFEVINQTNEHKRLHELMVSTILKETKMDRKTLEKIMNPALDYFVTPTEAIKLGIVDKIIGGDK